MKNNDCLFGYRPPSLHHSCRPRPPESPPEKLEVTQRNSIWMTVFLLSLWCDSKSLSYLQWDLPLDLVIFFFFHSHEVKPPFIKPHKQSVMIKHFVLFFWCIYFTLQMQALRVSLFELHKCLQHEWYFNVSELYGTHTNVHTSAHTHAHWWTHTPAVGQRGDSYIKPSFI